MREGAQDHTHFCGPSSFRCLTSMFLHQRHTEAALTLYMSQLNTLSPGLPLAILTGLSGQQVASLASAFTSGVTVPMVSGLIGEQLSALTSSLSSGVSALQIVSLTVSQMTSLSTALAAGMAASSLSTVTPSQMAAATDALAADLFTGMSTAVPGEDVRLHNGALNF